MVVIEDAELRMERVCAPLRYHPCATVTKVVGTTNFPPSFAAAGYAAGFRGFGPPPGARSPAGSRDADDARPAFVERASIFPDPPRGAFQHVAVFKNILVAADGDASARLHVFDVRDWSEKQVIRVGELDPRAPSTAPPPPPPSSPPRSARSRSTARPSPSARTRASCTRGGSRSARASAATRACSSP